MTISRTSRDLLKLSLVRPWPFRCPGCICLTWPERQTLRRVAQIVGKWKRQARRQVQRQAGDKAGDKARDEAQARLAASAGTPQG
ncbi:MAG: hypothetical protein V3R17_04010 [Hyphomicrobium sp.]